MITRAIEAKVLAEWATADEVYGADPALRAQIEAPGLGYVLAIGCDRRVSSDAARPDRCRATRALLAAVLGRGPYETQG
jgi:SRSO17 transposase